ncbi:MAG: hypothetical protein V2J24_14940 [Pseudomonadales bacterium]|nr:hypothetical protein [Pseudomonadales bacterium]
MSRPLSAQRIDAEHRHFVATVGVGTETVHPQRIPAFRDSRTGRIEISRFEDGRPAPMHLIEGLPDEWALAHDADGHIRVLKAEIACGFVCGGRFYTRAEAAELRAPARRSREERRAEAHPYPAPS